MAKILCVDFPVMCIEWVLTCAAIHAQVIHTTYTVRGRRQTGPLYVQQTLATGNYRSTPVLNSRRRGVGARAVGEGGGGTSAGHEEGKGRGHVLQREIGDGEHVQREMEVGIEMCGAEHVAQQMGVGKGEMVKC